MRWLENGYQDLQLDIVGFLAILGEASIKVNAQVHQLSAVSLLPQLIPAPQALIRTTRPIELKPAAGKVIGSRSGGKRDRVNYIAYLLHSRDPLDDYHVRCERIEKPNPKAKVSSAPWGPLTIASLVGCAMSIALLVIAAVRQDGFGLLATILLAFLSTLIGIGSRWSLELKQRASTRKVPPDRIVVVYPNGSFRIIICSEEVARELYWHPETCHYKFGEGTYRFISLIGTLTLMVGVVCLGNASLDLQVGFGAAYLVLNALYWIVAALPPQWHWDLSCYNVTRERYEGGEENNSFTSALWKAIAISGNVDWVRIGAVAPVSEAWKEWVQMAEATVLEEQQRLERERGDEGHLNGSVNGGGTAAEKRNAEKPLPQWDAERALTECLNPDQASKAV